jgi:sulfur carrier protein
MITVNSEPLPWHDGMTVRDVLTVRKYAFPLLIVRIDGILVPRDSYDSAPVPDGAVVDVVHLMSGG